MGAFKIYLPDGSSKDFPNPPTALDVALAIGPRLAKDAVGVVVRRLGTEIQDVRLELSTGDHIRLVTLKDPEANEVLRHSAAHVLAQAVQSLWPDVKVTIGPVIENGFYYDFDTERAFTPEDLERIEKKMEEIIKGDAPVTKEVWTRSKAIETFKKMGERFKVEIIEDLGEDHVSVYHQGDWFDLCRGPHVQRLGQIKAVKVQSVAGSYWRGDEKKGRLQRIYGTAFTSKEALTQHLNDLEEAKKRDHRRLGKDLGLFVFHPLSPGGPFFTAKGATIYHELQRFIREKYREHAYDEVITPQVFDVDLFHQSGHYANYRENMYFSRIEERDYALKPMNCPSHCLIFASSRHSYRDLPLRMADFGRLHRYERSGVMHGLTRVRTFCQDDAHIFCRMDQIESEIESFMRLLNEVYQTLGMSRYEVFFSTRPEKRMGTDEYWDFAEGALEKALKKLNIPYKLNPGDGAFYGPKLDIMFVDSINRPWQLGTLQVDPNLPEAFGLTYVGEDNGQHRPVMLHRAILGSVERFIGVFLEHTSGRLPTWLSPTQVRVLNVTDGQLSYCQELNHRLQQAGIRTWLDDRSEKLGYKIRDGQTERVPYLVVIGEKEKSAGTVSVRLGQGQLVNNLSWEQFIDGLKQEIGGRLLKSPWWNDSFKNE
jgi:threonyl-tRNA synthetase